MPILPAAGLSAPWASFGFSLSLWDYPIPHAFNNRLWPACPRLGMRHTLEALPFFATPIHPVCFPRHPFVAEAACFAHPHKPFPASPSCRALSRPSGHLHLPKRYPIRRPRPFSKLLKTAATQVSSPPHSRLSRRTAVRQSQRRFDVYLQQLSPSNRIRGTVFSD